MGHLLFCILHFLALLFGVVGLFITIPLHLIYSAVSKPRAAREKETVMQGEKRCGSCGAHNIASNTNCISCGDKIY